MSAGQEQIDTRALEVASQAMGKVDAHLEESRHRYAEQAGAMRELRTDIKGIYRAIDKDRTRGQIWRERLLWGVIVALGALAAYLLAEGRPWASEVAVAWATTP